MPYWALDTIWPTCIISYNVLQNLLIYHIIPVQCLCGVNILPFFKMFFNVFFWGGADGRVVKVLDSQPRDRGFESRHTLGLLCLKSLGKICTPNVP